VVAVAAPIIALLALGALTSPALAASPSLDDFARCLTRKGATMYSAWWCPSCRAQLEAFGDSADLLDYVECYVPGTGHPGADCEADDIRSYPTWMFRDGSRLTGKLPLRRLAEKTGCPLPEAIGRAFGHATRQR
jgi:hypothetical protein